MKITNQVVKNIIKRVIQSQDYRIEIVNLLNAEFLQFSIDFFKRVVDAKIHSDSITIDWYKEYFLSDSLSSDEIIINSGLNKKTISNMYGSASRKIVLDASIEHFESLYSNINYLIDSEQAEIDIKLTIKFKDVSIDLSISESLIVINTLAVKRSQLRGGLWSTAGKRVEKYLMLTLCNLYKVPISNYNAEAFTRDRSKDVDREVDFYLLNDKNKYRCEVKLMGRGNPESADAIIARDSDIFIADTLSEQNKNQCSQLGVYWVALRDNNGYQKFGDILNQISIPHTNYNGNLDEDLNNILDELLDLGTNQ